MTFSSRGDRRTLTHLDHSFHPLPVGALPVTAPPCFTRLLARVSAQSLQRCCSHFSPTRSFEYVFRTFPDSGFLVAAVVRTFHAHSSASVTDSAARRELTSPWARRGRRPRLSCHRQQKMGEVPHALLIDRMADFRFESQKHRVRAEAGAQIQLARQGS